MNYLYEAMRISDSVYLFDNSAGEPNMFAVKKDDVLTIQSDYVPKWFATYVIDKIEQQ